MIVRSLVILLLPFFDFRFVNKQASYPFGIISLAHVQENVTDFSIFFYAYQLNTCLFCVHKLVPRRFSLDGFYCIYRLKEYVTVT